MRHSMPSAQVQQDYREKASALRATNTLGFELTVLWIMTFCLGVTLASLLKGPLILASAIPFAIFQLQAFFLQHEAGHGTLFRSPRLNQIAGPIFSLVTVIPNTPWLVVHRAHHRWAGWQDKDPTTQDLVPKPRPQLFLKILNVAWRLGLPLIGLGYRFGSFWQGRLVASHTKSEKEYREARSDVWRLLCAEVLFLVLLARFECLMPWIIAFIFQSIIFEWVVLFQHSHIPQKLAGKSIARPFTGFEQMKFTRSLRIPTLLSQLLTFGFEHHEWHHAFPQVPGLKLAALDLPIGHRVNVLTWLFAARRMKASELLYKNSELTGKHL